MSNFTDFFPAAGGGGGGIPKYQEFTSSGTFTPTQALIDAGGKVSFIIVAGGQRGVASYLGGAGGAVRLGYATLTSTTGITVTIGAGGSGTDGASGGNTVVSFSSAGGADITSAGGSGSTAKAQTKYSGSTNGNNAMSSGMPSTLGYGGSGGATASDTFGGEDGKRTNIDNYGAGSFSGTDAASGFVRITWFE